MSKFVFIIHNIPKWHNKFIYIAFLNYVIDTATYILNSDTSCTGTHKYSGLMLQRTRFIVLA